MYKMLAGATLDVAVAPDLVGTVLHYHIVNKIPAVKGTHQLFSHMSDLMHCCQSVVLPWCALMLFIVFPHQSFLFIYVVVI